MKKKKKYSKNSSKKIPTSTIDIIDDLRNKISIIVKKTLKNRIKRRGKIPTKWEKLQEISSVAIKKLILKHLKNSAITLATSKSSYPDVKIVNSEGQFAIDVKSNENSKEPWFDMCRLDTMEKERIEKYVEEWEVVIKYDTKTQVIQEVFVGYLREFVGKDFECNGLLFRPYDGKVRPKSWSDFENNVVYWSTKMKFINAMTRSLKARYHQNIVQHLVPILSDEERKTFRKLFNKK